MKSLFLTALVAAIVAVSLFVGLQLVVNQSATGAAGSGYTHYQKENFLQGLYAGTQGQFEVTNAGAISSSAGVTLSGAATLSGAKTLSGSTTTLSGSNLLSNSTSTGFVIRGDNGNCYRIGTVAGVANTITFTTSSCSN